MGNARPKTLAALGRYGANLRVTCPRCGRAAVFELVQILNHFQARGWNLALEAAALRFTCRGEVGRPGCGTRGARLDMVPAHPHPPPPAPIARTRAKERAPRR